MDVAMKSRERRLRRAAARQGLQLHRSRTRDPRALDYGVYWLGRSPYQQVTSTNLDDIEAYLFGR